MILKMRKLAPVLAFMLLFIGCNNEKEAVLVEAPTQQIPPISALPFQGVTLVDEIDYREAKIHWNWVEGAVSYIVFMRVNNELEFKAHVVGEKKDFYVLKNLEPDTAYSILVRSMNSRGEFDANNNVVSFTTNAFGNLFNSSSLSFHGSSSLSIGESKKLHKNKNIGISFWFKTSTQQADARIINLQREGGGTSINVSLNNTGIQVGYRDMAGVYKTAHYPIAYHDGFWRHVYASYNGSKYRLYLDSVLVVQVSDTQIGSGSLPAHIASFAGTSPSFVGSLDEVSLWSAPFNQAQVAELYNLGVPRELREHSKWKNLLSWWRMGDSVGDSALEIVDVMEKTPAVGSGIVPGDFSTEVP